MVKNILKGTGSFLGIILFWALIFFVGAGFIVFKGEYVATKDIVTMSMLETSAAKFIPTLFLNDIEIQGVIERNTMKMTTDVTDTNLVTTNTSDPTLDLSAVTIHEVKGSTYKGKMMVVNDPSRVYVAAPAQFETEQGGMRVEEMVKRDGAIAGVNGGGFEDINGIGNGGKPLGIVIQNGVLTFGEQSTIGNVIGFDKDNKLVVGKMSAKEALEKNMRDAISFEPVGPLIINGEPLDIKGTGGGLNPRTAIGQRADGAVLILVIDGRQSHSIGANYSDLIEVMTEWNAVNAGNLDGGSSSLMVYEGEVINVCASLYGSRKIPTAMLVK